MFNKWDKIMGIYKWFSISCPVFIDAVLIILLGLFVAAVIGLLEWIAIAVFGWHLITIAAISLFVVTMIWLAFTHDSHPGGVKGWWDERPWKD